MTTKTILRFSHDKETPYTIISNSCLNGNLSLKAMGLLTYMLSKPDDCPFTLAYLSCQLNKTRNSLKPVVQELEDKGHIVKKIMRDDRGLFVGVSMTVYEVPAPGDTR